MKLQTNYTLQSAQPAKLAFGRVIEGREQFCKDTRHIYNDTFYSPREALQDTDVLSDKKGINFLYQGVDENGYYKATVQNTLSGDICNLKSSSIGCLVINMLNCLHAPFNETFNNKDSEKQ